MMRSVLVKRGAGCTPIHVEPVEPRLLLSVDLLDSTFGDQGIALHPTLSSSSDRAHAALLLPDGKILAGGESLELSRLTSRPALTRYLPDGSLDTTFDRDGRLTIDADAVNGEPAVTGPITALALQPDGKYVAAVATGGRLTVLRFDADGGLDPTFDGDGVARALVLADAYALAVLPDGSIVAAGGDDDFVLVRFKADGRPDGSFGREGIVLTDFAGRPDGARSMDIDAEGRLVVAGHATSAFQHEDFAIARYLPDGSLDPTFGSGGRVHTNYDSGNTATTERATAVDVAPDGRIVVAGYSDYFGQGIVMRFGQDGSLDPTFGNGGKLKPPAHAYAAVRVLPNDRILVGGYATVTTSWNRDFSVQRLNPDGSADASFGGGDGRAADDFHGVDDHINAMLLQPDGSIVAVGDSNTGRGSHEFALARYTSDGEPDASFDEDGKLVTDFPGHLGGSTGPVAVLPDGSVLVAGGMSNLYQFPLVRLHADGRIDASFGEDGRAQLNADPQRRISAVSDLAVSPDGAIYAVGTLASDFAVARYHADGTVDESFGTSGVAMVDFNGASDEALAVALQSDGKVIVGGTGNPNWAMIRLNADGSLDQQFAAQVAVPGALSGRIWDLLVDGADRIVAVGDVHLDGGSQSRAVRLLPDGALDGDFGLAGVAILGTRPPSVLVSVSSVLYGPDGELYVGGRQDDQSAIWALDSHGAALTSFGEGGRVLTAVGTRADFRDLSMDGQMLVAAGNAFVNDVFRPMLATYDLQGALVSAFGEGGVFLGSAEQSLPSLDVQAPGRYVGGIYGLGGLAVGRFLNDATLVVADVTNVTPDARTPAIDAIEIEFSAPITGLDLADLELTRDGGPDLLAGSEAMLTATDGTSYTLSNLTATTAPAGEYTLRLKSSGSGIATAAGEPLAADALETWAVSRVLRIEGGNSRDQFRLARSATDPDTIEIFVGVDSTTPAYSVRYPSLSAVQIRPLFNDDQVVLDLTNGSFAGPAKIEVYGADGRDALLIMGTGDGDDVTFEAGRVEVNGHVYLLSGMEEVRLPGGGRVGRLSLTERARARIVGDAAPLRTAHVSVEPGAVLDLGDRDLVVAEGDIRQVEELVRLGRVTSSMAQGVRGLAAGIVDGELVVKHTYNGDANLDGRIDADDYFRIDSGFLSQPEHPLYAQGDFNYDGQINADDYFLIDSAFLGQGEPLASGTPATATLVTGAALVEREQDETRRRPVRSLFSDQPVSVLSARRQSVARRR